MSIAHEDYYLTKKQTSEYLACSLRTIDNLIAAGEIPAYRLARKILFRKSELDSFIAKRRVVPRLAVLVEETLRDLGGGR